MHLASYFVSWTTVIYTIIAILGDMISYRQPQHHNIRTIVAIFTTTLLALISLLLLFAQARSIIPARTNSFGLFEAIFMLTLAIQQIAFPSKSQSGRGWTIFRRGFIAFAITFTIFALVLYIYNL